MMRTFLLGSAAVLLLSTAARADAVSDAKAYVAKVTAPVTTWDGPTSGAKGVGRKLIVFASTDQRNGGARGVGEGLVEAAKVLGWDVRTIDGQGSVDARAAAINQAVALKADGLVLGGIDAAEQAAAIENAAKAGLKIIGWHSGSKPGPMTQSHIAANITTDPLDVARAAASYAVADSDGKVGAVIFTDSAYAIAIAKSDEMSKVIKACSSCTLLSTEDTPLADAASRMPQLTTSLLQRYGKKWTYALSINDLTFDFMAPSLQSAGIDGDGAPHSISAGDGSEPAFQRIKSGDYQVGTVAEPLSLHGWMAADEMNRALAGAPPSGYVAPPHLFIKANVDKDGGSKDIYDPQNGYRDAYRKIWAP